MRRISFLFFGVLYGFSTSTALEAVAVGVSVYALLVFMSGLGRQIVLLECICLIATLEILLVPTLTYWVFPASMPVASEAYLSYAIPAYLAFCGGIYAGARLLVTENHQQLMQKVADYLADKQQTSLLLLLIGMGGLLVKAWWPGAPTFMGTLPSYCLYISAFYAYYANHRYRFWLLGGVGAVLVTNTVRTGMFGELFFWFLLLAIFIRVGVETPLSISKKMLGAGLLVWVLLLIQSIKAEYRYHTWGYARHERTGNAGLMAGLVTDRLYNPEKLFTTSHLYSACVRFNQGIMIGSAMQKVPYYENYAGGEVLLSFVYPLVPRLLWPAKPQTGGYENIRRFTSLPQSENTSINLSPLGEGYVNFGYGGIGFSGLYGLVLGSCFAYVLQRARQLPSLILWLPLLFMGCLTMETDLLSTWGSLLNGAMFMVVLFWSMKQLGVAV